MREPDVSEIATTPPARNKAGQSPEAKNARATLSDIPTIPPPRAHRNNTPLHTARNKISATARPPQREQRRTYHRPARFQPLDSLRWWLIRPGHIESLIWTGAIILLITFTGLIVYITLLSTGAPTNISSSPPGIDSTLPAPCDTAAKSKNCTVVSNSASNGLKLIVFNDRPFMTGGSIHVRGQGFRPRSYITLLHDDNRPCEPGKLRTDEHGQFNVTLQLANDPDWKPGDHNLIVKDATGQRSITVMFTLLARPIPTPIVTPTAAPQPSPTPTPHPSASGTHPPASQPTPPVVPTKGPQPKPTPPARPTTTPPAHPTVTPAQGVTATATAMEPSPTATTSPAAHAPWSPTLKADSTTSGATSWSDLVWLVPLGYILSLLLLAAALLLAKRHRR